MLFLLFQLGKARYALEARRVVEVIPFLSLSPLPHAPRGVAGIFNYRGRPIPAVDLCELTLGHPARERLSTRIIIVEHPSPNGRDHFLGLVAEHATEVVHKEAREFVETRLQTGANHFLGPVLMDAEGPIQWIHEQQVLPEPVRASLFSAMTQLSDETS